MAEFAAGDRVFARLNALMLGRDASSKLRRADLRIQEMESGGVDISVLSLPPPGVQFGRRELACRTASRANDELIAAAEASARRFCVLAAVPLPYSQEAVAELDRVARHPLVRGVGLMTNSAEWTLDDPRFEDFYAHSAELGFPVVLHPALEELPPAYGQWGLAAGLAPMISTLWRRSG